MKKRIILDCGGGNNTKNDKAIVKEMMDQIYDLSLKTDKELIVKFQLFKNIKNLISLDRSVFEYAYSYCVALKLGVTASVFDINSLYYFISVFPTFRTPSIKIACRDFLYNYIKRIPNSYEIFVSVDSTAKRNELKKLYPDKNMSFLFCCPEYPAPENRYRSLFYGNLSSGISDHCIGLDLYRRYLPDLYERHFILKHGDTDDPVGDNFCSTAREIEGIL